MKGRKERMVLEENKKEKKLPFSVDIVKSCRTDDSSAGEQPLSPIAPPPPRRRREKYQSPSRPQGLLTATLAQSSPNHDLCRVHTPPRAVFCAIAPNTKTKIPPRTNQPDGLGVAAAGVPRLLREPLRPPSHRHKRRAQPLLLAERPAAPRARSAPGGAGSGGPECGAVVLRPGAHFVVSSCVLLGVMYIKYDIM